MKHLVAAALCLVLPTGALAATNIVERVDFAGVPKGSKCGAIAPHAKKVKVQVTRKETRIKVRGDARGALFYCDLPDGTRLEAIVPKAVPDDAENAQFQITRDRRGILLIMHKGKLSMIEVSNPVRVRR